MQPSNAELASVGLEVNTLSADDSSLTRGTHGHDAVAQMEGLSRLATAFVEAPDTLLQKLVELAVELCGADSAGVSVERDDGTDEQFYKWIATAGVYTPFLDAFLPKYPSACTVCLSRGTPQKFRVDEKFFAILGVEAALVRDGILLPWQVDGMRGTIFIISHSEWEAFDAEDLRLMQIFANFVAMGIRQKRQQERLLRAARVSAAAEMANDLAHQINNPLQSMTNLLFLADHSSGEECLLAMKLKGDMVRLSDLTKRLLELPKQTEDQLKLQPA